MVKCRIRVQVNSTRIRNPAFYLAGKVGDNLSLVPEVVLVPHQDDRGGHLVLQILQFTVIFVWFITHNYDGYLIWDPAYLLFIFAGKKLAIYIILTKAIELRRLL